MRVDTKEFELPDTVYIRDIDSAVFQSIVLECLSKVQGIQLTAGSLMESLLGLESREVVKSITVEQDEKMHVVNVKVEVNIAYGVPIPAKAEEIQTLMTHEITKLTGLHVGSVHVVVKNIYFEDKMKKNVLRKPMQVASENEYGDEF